MIDSSRTFAAKRYLVTVTIASDQAIGHRNHATALRRAGVTR